MRVLIPAGLVLSGLILAGCAGADTGDEPAETVTVTQAAVAASPEPTAEPEPVESVLPEDSSAAPTTFVMPQLVGANLQDAQDTLQSLGSYLLDQADASGMDRMQMVDSNWQVCAQQPAAGTEVDISAMVQLSSVKLDEVCP